MLVQEHAWNCACDVLLMIRMPGLSRCIARERKVESKAEKLHKSRLAVGCRVDKHFPFEQREMWAVRASRNVASNSRFTRRSSYQTFLLCIQLYYFAKLHCIGLIFSPPKMKSFPPLGAEIHQSHQESTSGDDYYIQDLKKLTVKTRLTLFSPSDVNGSANWQGDNWMIEGKGLGGWWRAYRADL